MGKTGAKANDAEEEPSTHSHYHINSFMQPRRKVGCRRPKWRMNIGISRMQLDAKISGVKHCR